MSQVNDKLYHIILYWVHLVEFELTTSVVIGSDSITSCKSNYHTIMTMLLQSYTLSGLGANQSLLLILILYYCVLRGEAANTNSLSMVLSGIKTTYYHTRDQYATVLETKIWIYWSESNPWIYFYIVLKQKTEKFTGPKKGFTDL